MFSLPDAKRIRRDDLQSPQSSPRSSPDPAITELLHSRLQQQFSFAPANAIDNDGIAAEDDDDSEAEIRLFAAATPTAPSQKIRITSPDAEERESGFMVPHRPPSYYFIDEGNKNRRTELEAVAVGGPAILNWAKKPWPGCALPWKVTTISAAGLKKEVLAGHRVLPVVSEDRKKCRVGKKRRIAMHKKIQKVKAREDQTKKKLAEKEEAEREKRTRRNREKKVKKKAKEKAKKMAGAEGGADDDGEAMDVE